MLTLSHTGINNKSNPNFGIWNRTVYKEVGKHNVHRLVHRNDTSFVRNIGQKKAMSNADSWRNLINFLVNKFNNTGKVNIYNYACSDCSELYTFLMALMSRKDKNKDLSFDKIYAIDYDKEAINKAKKGEYKLSHREYNSIQDLTDNNIGEFLDISYDEVNKIYKAKPKDILKSKVELINADALKDYKRIKPQNSIVLARNFWPYLEEKMPALLEKFNERLKNNSVLVIGDFDKRACPYFGFEIIREIIKKGFKQTGLECIFEK